MAIRSWILSKCTAFAVDDQEGTARFIDPLQSKPDWEIILWKLTKEELTNLIRVIKEELDLNSPEKIENEFEIYSRICGPSIKGVYIEGRGELLMLDLSNGDKLRIEPHNGKLKVSLQKNWGRGSD